LLRFASSPPKSMIDLSPGAGAQPDKNSATTREASSEMGIESIKKPCRQGFHSAVFGLLGGDSAGSAGSARAIV
jgi:hypothetical protein